MTSHRLIIVFESASETCISIHPLIQSPYPDPIPTYIPVTLYDEPEPLSVTEPRTGPQAPRTQVFRHLRSDRATATG